MNTAVFTIKIDPKLKRQAQKIAERNGVSLAAIVKANLRKIVSEPEAVYCQFCGERESFIPNARLVKSLKQSEKDRKNGWVSPSFENAKDAIAWLDNPKRKYERDLHPELYKK